ncbi:MAG: hypothetical protein P8100_12335 [bacterium]
MKLKKMRKSMLIILSIVMVIVIGVILSLNLIIASVLRGKIDAALEKNKTTYQVSLGGVGGNIFFGNIRLKDITIQPDSTLIGHLREGSAKENMAIEAHIPLIRIAGIGLYDAIVNQEIDIRKLEVRKANIRLLKEEQKDEFEKEDGFNPDSIYLKNVSGISIGSILLTDNTIELYDLVKDKQMLMNTLSELRLSGILLQSRPGSEDVFRVVTDRFKLKIEKEEFDLPGGDYRMFFDDFEFTMSDSSLVISQFAYKPTRDRLEIATQYKYTREIFDMSMERLELQAIHIGKFIREGAFYMDSIDIYGLHLDILKDKRYPFNESLRPKLIHQAIRELDFPLYIGNAQIHESYLIYQEKEENVKEWMTVSLGELNVSADFITSVRDSTRTGRPMMIDLKARLMEKALLQVQFAMPLNSREDTFFFSGSLGPAPFLVFNQASRPALGAFFTGGELHSIVFKGSANRTHSSGEMTMLYKDLVAEVLKKDQKSKNKFLSWATNVALRTSNPNPRGKTAVAVMEFDRVMYKGFGNFMWKTLQSGIVNTVSPTGKNVNK